MEPPLMWIVVESASSTDGGGGGSEEEFDVEKCSSNRWRSQVNELKAQGYLSNLVD